MPLILILNNAIFQSHSLFVVFFGSKNSDRLPPDVITWLIFIMEMYFLEGRNSHL
jgi:hypothetical protein